MLAACGRAEPAGLTGSALIFSDIRTFEADGPVASATPSAHDTYEVGFPVVRFLPAHQLVLTEDRTGACDDQAIDCGGPEGSILGAAEEVRGG